MRTVGRTVLALEGDHDISTVPDLVLRLARCISDDATDVVLDVRRVTFIDAATINVFVRLQNHLGETGRALAIRSPSPSVRRVLAICGLSDTIEPG